MGDTRTEHRCASTPRFAVAPLQTVNTEVHRACLSCGSERTQCVYFDYGGSICGYTRDEEHRCLECGMFTVFSEEYDS